MTASITIINSESSCHLIQLVVGEEHTGLLDGLSLLFLGGGVIDLGFEFTCKFHDENLRKYFIR